jgi:hypothetical protein
MPKTAASFGNKRNPSLLCFRFGSKVMREQVRRRRFPKNLEKNTEK